MALNEWVRPLDDRSHLHSVQLRSRAEWPERLVAFSSHGWHSFTRMGAPNPMWAQMANTIIRPTWIDVLPAYVTGINDVSRVLKPRSQYRKAQPAKKTYALAASLRQSAEAIRAKRG